MYDMKFDPKWFSNINISELTDRRVVYDGRQDDPVVKLPLETWKEVRERVVKHRRSILKIV